MQPRGEAWIVQVMMDQGKKRWSNLCQLAVLLPRPELLPSSTCCPAIASVPSHRQRGSDGNVTRVGWLAVAYETC